MSGLGDVNNDGFDDVGVGAWRENPDLCPIDCGMAYVYCGMTGNVVHELRSPNPEANGWFGASIASLDDIDGDAVPEILVGAPREDPAGSPQDAGRAYIFSGRTAELLHTLVSPNESADGQLGWNGSGLMDTDQDGYPDVAVSSFEQSGSGIQRAGRVHVYSGSTGQRIFTIDSPNSTSTGAFGTVVCGNGDVNGDGRCDLSVGAVFENSGGMLKAGSAYVVDLSDLSAVWDYGIKPEIYWNIDAFPNPVRKTFYLRIANIDRILTRPGVLMCDLTGRCLSNFETDWSFRDQIGMLRINLPAEYSAGTYIVRLNVGAHSIQIPVVAIQ